MESNIKIPAKCVRENVWVRVKKKKRVQGCELMFSHYVLVFFTSATGVRATNSCCQQPILQ